MIVGSELSLTLSQPSSFGFSFSNGLDVDGNGYPGKTVYMVLLKYDIALGRYFCQVTSVCGLHVKQTHFSVLMACKSRYSITI